MIYQRVITQTPKLNVHRIEELYSTLNHTTAKLLVDRVTGQVHWITQWAALVCEQ